jgi:hypothetical protein
MRITAYETDDYQVVKSRCLLSVIEIAVRTLIKTNKNKDFSELIGKFKKLLAAHGMSYVPNYDKLYSTELCNSNNK